MINNITCGLYNVISRMWRIHEQNNTILFLNDVAIYEYRFTITLNIIHVYYENNIFSLNFCT